MTYFVIYVTFSVTLISFITCVLIYICGYPCFSFGIPIASIQVRRIIMKYKLKPGFTKASVMAQIRKYNDGTRAVDATNTIMTCVYETDDGNRCAIGCFIPDGHPALELRGNISIILSEFPVLLELMPFHNIDSLKSFQAAHDDPIVFGSSNVYDKIQRFLDNECEES